MSDQGSQDAFLNAKQNLGDVEANDDREVTTSSNKKDKSRGTRSMPEIDINCAACCDTTAKKWAWGVLVLLALVVGIVLLGLSLKRLESTQYGLEYHPRRKKLDDVAQQGGLHPGPPGYKFVKFPSTFIVSCTYSYTQTKAAITGRISHAFFHLLLDAS